jgi:hypothetical protein
LKEKPARLLVIDIESRDIRRQEVGRELNPFERTADTPCEGFGDQGFSQSRHILQQDVTVRKNRDKEQFRDTVFADNNPRDISQDGAAQIEVQNKPPTKTFEDKFQREEISRNWMMRSIKREKVFLARIISV